MTFFFCCQGAIDANTVRTSHFGGFQADLDRPDKAPEEAEEVRSSHSFDAH